MSNPRSISPIIWLYIIYFWSSIITLSVVSYCQQLIINNLGKRSSLIIHYQLLVIVDI